MTDRRGGGPAGGEILPAGPPASHRWFRRVVIAAVLAVAIPLLGAQAHPGGPSAFLAARLDVAVELFDDGRISAILVTGDGLERANFETRVMRDYLVERGIPDAKIVEDPAGFDTYDSCVRDRDVFGVEELTLVSQDYHLPRAVTICRARASTPSAWATPACSGATRTTG